MKGVILAGGMGTRLEPLTRVTNKHLLPVYNKPMIEYPLNTLVRMGIKDIIVVVGGNSVGDFIEYLGNGSDRGISITYRFQSTAAGIAHGVLMVKDLCQNEPFAVILGDNIFTDNFSENLSAFAQHKAWAHVFLKRVDKPNRFGVANMDKNFRIEKIEEKPISPKSNFAVTGLYLYRPEVFGLIEGLSPSPRGELEITDLHNLIIQKNLLSYDVMEGFWSDAGTFESLFNASTFIRGVYGNA